MVFAFLLLTRVPVAAEYLSIDNVNLAFALEEFNPHLHQPQPPGYPFFVLFAKIVNVLFRDAERTFVVVSVLVSALSLPVLYLLASRMFNAWAARAAVLLLLVNPVFWHSGLDGPLRPNLALFSLATGYCAWRAWNGEERFVLLGAAALGVGSGFRPDLIAYLLPVWAISAWVGTRSLKTVGSGALILAGIVAIWVGALAYAMGGAGELYQQFRSYAVEQSRPESMVLGAGARQSLRQLSRLFTWNGLAVVGWIWALPLLWLGAKSEVLSRGREVLFIALWTLPGIGLQAALHVANPGHTLFSVPVWCLAGGYVLYAALERWSAADTGLVGAAVLNALLFLGFIPLPPAGSPGGIRDSLAVGTFETSLAAVRWADDIHRTSLKQIHEFTSPDLDTVIIAQDVPKQDWFLNWRIARYYLPDREIRVIEEQANQGATRTVRGRHVSVEESGSPVEIRLDHPSRILWLLEPGAELYKALEVSGRIQGGPKVFYTDVADEMPPFIVRNLRIVPHSPGATVSGIQ